MLLELRQKVCKEGQDLVLELERIYAEIWNETAKMEDLIFEIYFDQLL